MPPFVEEALREHALWEAFQARPPYQRNDYMGWISKAKKLATQERRLAQMLDELEAGDRYMKMPYGKKKTKGKEAKDVGLPPFLEEGLRSESKAWAFFESLSPSCKRAYVQWIQSAVRQATKEKRLKETIGMLLQGKKHKK
jgi:uncharacterized protein YdeI (YjbR/CyaY-like superfamily)